MREFDHREKENDKAERIMRRRNIMLRMEEEALIARKKKSQTSTSNTDLQISHPADAHEQQADAVAKKLVSGADASAEMKTQHASSDLNTKQEEGALMAKSEDGTLTGTEKLQNTLDSSKGGVQALDDATQSEMGEKMGADLSGVRIHTDSKANEMSEGINAKAFTHGQDIYFKEGNFDTDSNEGKELLAHELVHTVQQRYEQKTKVQSQWEPDKTDQKPPTLTSELFGNQSYFQRINNGEVTMYRRQRGWHVGYLQRALQALGYDIGNDEAKFFGEGTENALKNFQKNAGFIGDNVDGILGKNTLRILDFDYSLTEPKIEQNEASHLVFKIPVTADMKNMTHDQYEIVVASWIFGITEGEAETLMQNYFLRNWEPLTDEDIERGYKRVAISKEIYYQYAPKQEEGGEDDSASLEELKERLFGMEDAYKLYQKDEDDPQLLILLKENGFNSVEEFKEETDRFLRLFEREAVRTTFNLLDKSYTQIKIEEAHYSDESGVADFKNNVVEKLTPIYDEADKLLLEALDAYYDFERSIAIGVTSENEHKFREDMLNEEFSLPDRGIVTHGQLINGEVKNLSRKDFDEVRTLIIFFTRNMIINGGHRNIRVEDTQAYKKALIATAYQEQQENEFVLTNVARFPILADPQAREDLRKFTVNTSEDDLGGALRGIVADRKGNLLNMYVHFKDTDNYEDVWELPPVIQNTKEILNISTGSTLDLIIAEKLEDVASVKLWTSIGLAALGIGLAIASIATAGAASVGFLALGAAVSGVDFYLEYSNYQFQKQAYGSAFDRDKSLAAVDPSIVWVVLSAIGLGLDIIAVGKAIKLFNTVAKGSNDVSALAKVLAQELKEAGRLSEEVAEAFAKNIEKIQQIKAIKALPEEDMLRIAEQIVLNPKLVDGLLEMDNILKTTSKLSDADLEVVFKFYASAGNDAIEDIPQLLRISKEGAFSENNNLMKEVFTNLSVQRVMLENADKPQLISKLWDDFVMPRANPLQSKRFGDYLRYLKYPTSVKTKSLLTDVFGPDFMKLGNKAKNVQVLSTTEQELSKKLLAGIANPEKSEFSENLLKKVDELLNENLIEEVQTLEAARHKIVSRLNKILGEEAMDFTELRKILSETQQSGSSGSIFEHWVRNKINSLGNTTLRLADDTLVKIDSYRLEKGFAIFTEAKYRPTGTTLSGHDLKQLENYQQLLIESPFYKINGKQLPIKFEYIFDNKNAALRNIDRIKRYLENNVELFYISKTGKKIKL